MAKVKRQKAKEKKSKRQKEREKRRRAPPLRFYPLPSAFLLIARRRAVADGRHALHIFLRLIGGRANSGDAEAELVGVRRAAERLLHRDQAGLVERKQRLVEGLHPVLRSTGGYRVA